MNNENNIFIEPFVSVSENKSTPGNGLTEYFLTSMKMAYEFFRYYDGRPCMIYAVKIPRCELVTCLQNCEEFFKSKQI